MPQPQLRWVGIVFLIALLSACGGPGAPPVLPPGTWGGPGFVFDVNATYAFLRGGLPYSPGTGNISGAITLDATGAFDVTMTWHPCGGGVPTPTPGVDETPVSPPVYQERLRGMLSGNEIHLRDPHGGSQEIAVLLPNAPMTGVWGCE